MERSVHIVEVGPRDGLQNETATIPTDAKVALVDALSATGVDEIEVSAFVAPRKVPQLADAAAVFGRIRRRAGVTYSALVPNERGLERAVAAGVDKLSVFAAVSETFNRRNINTSVAGALRRFAPIARRADRLGLPVRGYVSTAFWCAFEGRIAPAAVVELSLRLMDLGVGELAISDTIGKAVPPEVARLLDALLPRVGAERIAMHFHDTHGHAVANVIESWGHGIRIFDASVGGLGGCPFAPGATGNVATEAVVRALADQGVAVGVAPAQLVRARRLLDPYLRASRRTRPAVDTQACSVCEHFTGAGCCDPEPAAG
jgi:hydroxymethylglutaryl-CoA lyase